MNWRWRRGVIVAAVVGLAGAAALAQDKPAKQEKQPPAETKKPPAQAEMDEMMAAWMKYAAPGEYHGHLKPLAGKWDQAVKCQMSPEAPVEEITGASEVRWILGGRFLLQETKGAPMAGGEAFEGLGLLGYDNYKKKYVSVWVDNMGTMVFTAEGTCDKGGKVITFVGEYDDPATGQKKKGRSVYRIETNDKHVFEMYEAGPDGKEFRMLEATYTRKP